MRIALVGVALLAGLVVWFDIERGNRDRCRFVDGREVVTRNCIPYCPPDPKECD